MLISFYVKCCDEKLNIQDDSEKYNHLKKKLISISLFKKFGWSVLFLE